MLNGFKDPVKDASVTCILALYLQKSVTILIQKLKWYMWGGKKQQKTERTSRSWRNKNFWFHFMDLLGRLVKEPFCSGYYLVYQCRPRIILEADTSVGTG